MFHGLEAIFLNLKEFQKKEKKIFDFIMKGC